MSLLLRELIKIGSKMLSDVNIADSEFDAKEIFCHVNGYDRTRLFMHWSDIIPDNQCDRYFEEIEKRATHIPLQHLTGSQDFMGLTFKVTPDVLIPRLDTETVVEEAMKLVPKNSDILDLCSGSGAIGISLAKLADAKVTCTDISEEALKVAEGNASLNKVKVKFIKSDMFESLRGGIIKKKYDMIISNPPYIPKDVIETLDIEVKDHEPRLALDGGDDGLDFYRIIAKEAPEFLRKNGILVLEIGDDQGESVPELLRETDAFSAIETKKDLAGLDRMVIAVLKKQ